MIQRLIGIVLLIAVPYIFMKAYKSFKSGELYLFYNPFARERSIIVYREYDHLLYMAVAGIYGTLMLLFFILAFLLIL